MLIISFIKRFWQGIKTFCKRYDKILIGAICGSFVTIIVAMIINYAAQKHIAERAHLSELHRRNLKMREVIFRDVHKLVSTQMFCLDRFIWAYPLKHKQMRYKELHQYWKNYINSLRDMDIKYRKYEALLELYYSPQLAKEFCDVHCHFQTARKTVRRYWRNCAVNECTPQEKAKTLDAMDEKDTSPRMKAKIDRCIQHKKIKLRNKNNLYSINTYIRCVVADTRNTVIRFSRDFVTVHKEAQKKDIDHRVDEKGKSPTIVNCNC